MGQEPYGLCTSLQSVMLPSPHILLAVQPHKQCPSLLLCGLCSSPTDCFPIALLQGEGEERYWAGMHVDSLCTCVHADMLGYVGL